MIYGQGRDSAFERIGDEEGSEIKRENDEGGGAEAVIRGSDASEQRHASTK